MAVPFGWISDTCQDPRLSKRSGNRSLQSMTSRTSGKIVPNLGLGLGPRVDWILL